jgi:hypothetical protein
MKQIRSEILAASILGVSPMLPLQVFTVPRLRVKKSRMQGQRTAA